MYIQSLIPAVRKKTNVHGLDDFCKRPRARVTYISSSYALIYASPRSVLNRARISLTSNITSQRGTGITRHCFFVVLLLFLLLFNLAIGRVKVGSMLLFEEIELLPFNIFFFLLFFSVRSDEYSAYVDASIARESRGQVVATNFFMQYSKLKDSEL